MVLLFTLHVKRGLVFLLSSCFDFPAYTSANSCSGVLLCSFVHELRKSFTADGFVGNGTSLLSRLMVSPRKQAKPKHFLCRIILTRSLKRPLRYSLSISYSTALARLFQHLIPCRLRTFLVGILGTVHFCIRAIYQNQCTISFRKLIGSSRTEPQSCAVICINLHYRQMLSQRPSCDILRATRSIWA